MPDVVTVSSIDRLEKVRSRIDMFFMSGLYDEITQAIGMHSILIDPQHTMDDQRQLYGRVLALIKDSVSKAGPKQYAAWLSDFPKLMAGLSSSGQVITDKAAALIITDYHNAYGPFKSVDEYFLWALADRRLPMGQIVKYILKTAEMKRK